jgi:hypothetical protein
MENVLTQKLENAWNFFIIPGTPWKTYKWSIGYCKSAWKCLE